MQIIVPHPAQYSAGMMYLETVRVIIEKSHGGKKMHTASILLGLTGSEQSQYAAEVAWSIAKRINARVTADHVVDTRMAWELLRNDRPGFIGSGVFIDAFESFSKSLNSIGESLINKFESVAQGQSVPTEVILEQGSPVVRLAERARRHDLVVIGHQPRDAKSKEPEHCNFIRYAVAEGLAHECPKPLLIVQNKVYNWKSMTILVSVDHLNFPFIHACMKMADLLGLQPNLVALASGVREESPSAFLEDLRKAHPELVDMALSVEIFHGMALENRGKPWQPVDLDFDWLPEADTLMVIPTRLSGRDRITVFDTTPDSFVRYLALPSIMMWPEECIGLDIPTSTAGQATAIV